MNARQQQRLVRGAAWFASWVLRGLFLTLRPMSVQQSILGRLIQEKTPFVLAFWHGRMLYALQLAQIYRQVRVTVMVSRSQDGEFISQVSQHFGVRPTRGSTSRGGSRAMLEMVRRVQEGYVACITPDGPRGPRYRVQPGVITVAQKTGAPILPLAYNAEWKKVFQSWDRFVMPLPFSRIVVVFGEPISVPAHATPDMLQVKQQEVEASLRQVMEIADTYFQTGARQRPHTGARVE
ncbi:MAG: lysophospholipid acyltransferase family protein [Candidatus Tectomicrobia bacterium]|nr:lysophospholipid acyltransferase family protein [Candidatus Tectomicrobia bacterium]